MRGELCVKSGYSILSSTLKIEDIISISKSKNYDYLCLMDSSVMYGCMESYKACITNNIKPLIGMEIELDNEMIVALIAKDYNGYLALSKLSSYINVNKLKVNLEMIKEYKDNLIVILPSYRAFKKINKDSYENVLDYFNKTFPYFYLA